MKARVEHKRYETLVKYQTLNLFCRWIYYFSKECRFAYLLACKFQALKLQSFCLLS